MQNFESAHTKYLCVELWLILHFEVSISVTTDFPVNWPQCQRPWKHPIFEGVFFAKLSLLRRLPLEGCLRFQHNPFQFLRTECVEWWRRTESEFLLGLKVEFEGFFGELEKSRVVLSQTSLTCQIKFCIQRTIFKITNILLCHFVSLPHSDMCWVLKDNVIDLETVCGNSHQNSASREDWCWDTCRPCHSSLVSAPWPSSPRHTCSPTTTRSRIPFLQDNQPICIWYTYRLWICAFMRDVCLSIYLSLFCTFLQ